MTRLKPQALNANERGLSVNAQLQLLDCETRRLSQAERAIIFGAQLARWRKKQEQAERIGLTLPDEYTASETSHMIAAIETLLSASVSSLAA